MNGQRLRVTSPQGRFRGDARKVSGSSVRDVEAVGKHLFYHFDNDAIVHVHLGRYGSFRDEAAPPPKPVGQIRMRMSHDNWTLDLRGPTRCRVIDETVREEVIAKLGPDPLAGGKKVDVWQLLHTSDKPIATLLLDQSVVAGVGNIFRAEMLFEAGIDPLRRGSDLSVDQWSRLWKVIVRQMKTGLKYGKIVTPTAAEAGKPRAKLERLERFRVYGHTHCPQCGQTLRIEDVGNRRMYWCGRCQTA